MHADAQIPTNRMQKDGCNGYSTDPDNEQRERGQPKDEACVSSTPELNTAYVRYEVTMKPSRIG